MYCLRILILIVSVQAVKSTFFHGTPVMHQPPMYLPPHQPYPVYVVIQKHVMFPKVQKPVNGPCIDVQGNWIPYGRLYFDGVYWRLCGMGQKVKPGYGILERKWRMLFRMLDVNKDGVMSRADEVRMVDLFVQYFALQPPKPDAVRNSITLAWRLLLLGKPEQMTETEFVQHMWSSYTLRRKILFTTIMKITDLLLFVTDNNKDGYISFREWEVLFKVLGVHDQRAAHILFKCTGPNFWGYSTILGARQFIMNLILDQDPHYFFKFERILEPAGITGSRLKPSKLPANGLKPSKIPIIGLKPSKIPANDLKPSIIPANGLKPSEITASGLEPTVETAIGVKPLIKPVVVPGSKTVVVQETPVKVKTVDNGIGIPMIH